MDYLNSFISFVYALVTFLTQVCTQDKFGQTTSKHKSERERLIQQIYARGDSHVPPNYDIRQPTVVTVELFISQFNYVSESTMDYALTVLLRQSWTDRRLKFNTSEHLEHLELDTRVMNKVWVPDLYFVNEKKAHFHEVTIPNKMMHITPNGTVTYSSRISMTLNCYMALQKYPFDTQICEVEIESYSYSTTTLIFQWSSNGVVVPRKMQTDQFELTKTRYKDCNKTYTGNPGIFTCLKADFRFVRISGFYVVQIYFPNMLIVFLSWISFWLDTHAVPTRITLGVLTILTMSTQKAFLNKADMPKVSVIKAVDVWAAMCQFFVFAALIEFAYVNVYVRKERVQFNNAVAVNRAGMRDSWIGHDFEADDLETESQKPETTLMLARQAKENESEIGVKDILTPLSPDTKPEEINSPRQYFSLFGLPLSGKTSPQSGVKSSRVSSASAHLSQTPKDDEGARDDVHADRSRLFSQRLISKSIAAGRKAIALDKISRILFPGAFLIFNIFYWTFYYTWEPEEILRRMDNI